MSLAFILNPIRLGCALAFVALRLVAGTDAPLADAAEKQNVPAIGSLIRQGADPNAAQADGMTALHWAALHEQPQTAELLLQAGANVDAENQYGVTPLSLACLTGNEALVKLFLSSGANPNKALRGGETPLMTAARTGRPGPIQLLFAHGATVNAKERRGQTAIMWAAAEGHVEAVKELMKAGADFQTPLESGFTPFLFAVREGRIEIVRLFLQAGADANAVMQTRKNGPRGPGKGMSPLLLAVENGHYELAVALLEAGADPNDQRSGFSPLHALTWVRKPNRGDGEDGDPSPIGSGQMSSLQFVRELAARGANINARLQTGRAGRGELNRKGATPFLLAAYTADVPYMQLLLELGADPSLRNADQSTPLMAAAGLGTLAPGEQAGTEEEAVEAVKLLLSHGADIDAVDLNGETAMHGAAYKSFPKVVELLAERGAKIEIWNRTNKYGWTPLLIAQGYRPGNFRPVADTIAAVKKVMIEAGVQPPEPPPIVAASGPEYPSNGTNTAPPSAQLKQR